MNKENLKREKRQLVFDKLTYEEDVDISGYKEIIDYAFKDKMIKNIGITGGYGSGKSSVINTYFEKENKEFIKVSLASFDGEVINQSDNDINVSLKLKKDDEENIDGSAKLNIFGSKECDNKRICNKNQNIALREVEEKLVNQLLHNIDPKKIGQSRLRVKEEYDFYDVVLGCVVILFMLFPFGELVFMNSLRTIFSISTLHNVFVFGGCLSVVATIVAMYKVFLYLISRKKINKISLKGGAVELNDIDNASYFDDYMDEIVYIIRNSGVSNFIFEDLDRFEYTSIFVRLREINNIVNLKNDGEPIRFFYLVRDGLFKRSDRTKFFDLIIPIVPYMSTENAYEKLCKDNVGKEIKADFGDSFLRGVCVFFEDYRLLKNCLNEYIVYKARVGEIEDNDKLLALIIYKNLFCYDFDALVKQEGVLYKLLNLNLKKDRGESSRAKELDDDTLYDRLKALGIENTSYEYRLLKFLIKNGKLDETYSEYLSSFDGIRMSTNDHRFFMSIYGNDNLGYEYKLDNPELISEKIGIEDFGTEQALNFSLLDYLIKENKSAQINKMLERLKKEDNVDFVIKYIEYGADKRFLYPLFDIWKDLFAELCTKSDENDNLLVLAAFIVNACNTLWLTKWASKDELGEYISSHCNVIPKLELPVKNKLSLLKVEFEQVFSYEYGNSYRLEECLKEKYKAIFRDGFFVVNRKNIEALLYLYNGENYNRSIFVTQLYQIIDQEAEYGISNILSENLESIVEDMLPYINEIIDDEEVSIRLLNEEKVANSCLEKYIKKMTGSIDDIRKIQFYEVLGLVLKEGKTEKSLDIAYKYYHTLENGVYDDNLICYLNRFNKSDFRTSQKRINMNKAFWNAAVGANGLADSVYRMMMDKTENISYDVPAGLTIEKAKILIEMDKLLPNSGVIYKLGNAYGGDSEVVYWYSAKHPELYIEYAKKYSSDISAVVVDKLLRSEGIVSSTKIELISYCKNYVGIKSYYEDDINIKLIEAKGVSIQTLKESIKQYSKFSVKVREVLLQYYLQYFNQLSFNNVGLQLLSDLIYSFIGNEQRQINIIKNNIEGLTLKDLRIVFTRGKMYKYLLLLKMSKKPKDSSNYDSVILNYIASKKRSWR